MKVDGKVAVLVGAGREGIGRAYCEALLGRGAKICIADILAEEGEAAEKTLGAKYGIDRVTFVKCDVTKQGDIDHVFEVAKAKYGRIDICNYNAAIINEFDFSGPVDVNLCGLIRYTNTALRFMGKDRGGHGGVVVNTASVSSLYPDDWGPVYCATKAALLAYTRAWALPANYEKHGIRFNVVCPANVDTKFTQFVRPGRVHHAEDKQEQLATADNIPSCQIADQLIRLVEDDSFNGAAIEVAAPGKVRIVPFLERDF